MFISLDDKLIQVAIAQIKAHHNDTLPASLVWAAAHEQIASEIRKQCAELDRLNSGLEPLIPNESMIPVESSF